ncbi:hypothetical protein HDU86_002096 [Geranomyces michiganensis]|nr:hypothetical protein HDU86_002096 [Geranomyces michiganensis]
MTAPALPQSGRAIVKSVLSGDTGEGPVRALAGISQAVVLRGKPAGGPPPEKIMALSNLSAPRTGTASKPENEEAFAYESREFLRRLLVGKEVQYKVEYTTSTNQRDFGVLHIQHPVNGEHNINRLVVKEGWARLRPAGAAGAAGAGDGKKRTLTEEQEQLADLEADAAAQRRGVFQDQVVLKSIRYDVKDDARAFLDKYKGMQVPAVLEQVRDGSTFRVSLDLPDGIRQYMTLMLSGLKAPTVRKGIPNVQDVVEEYSEEAKYFVESRLLHRDVTVILEGLSSNDMFVGSVQFPLGNIGEALLAEGLAKTVDWNISLVTGGAQKYRAAEQRAKDKRLRIWKSYVGKAKITGPEPEFDAIVTRVFSGDTLLVESVATGRERRITLASIRAPKGPEKKKDNGNVKDAAIKEYGYDFEAREFLRSRYIGKQVHVLIEYVKPAEGGFDERECATVTFGAKNLAETLVTRGLADIIRHRRDDDNRSSAYDQLLQAHEKAQTAQKGIHSPKEPPVYRISDASANVAKAKSFFPYLQRAGNVAGVVDYVSSGSRFRIFVPTQNCTLTLVLGGIRAPRAAMRPGEKAEPFGVEALAFAAKRAMQRDVEFSVEGQDKVGGFIGTLYVTGGDNNSDDASKSGDRKSLAVLLLEQGLASVHEYSASQSPNAHAMYEAEKKAKEGRRGMWKSWTPESEQQQGVDDDEFGKNNTAVDETRPLATKEVVVSHIEGGGRMFLQILGPELDRLEDLMGKFAQHHRTSTTSADFAPRAGELCSGQFTADDQWYRARVKKVNHADKTFSVIYVDYGNAETIPASRLRPLDPAFSISVLPPQAVEARLAYVTAPALDAEYGHDAFEHLRDATEGTTLIAKVVGKCAGVATAQALSVVLYVKAPRGGHAVESINEMVVRDGFGTIEKQLARRLAAEQQTADKATLWARAQSAKRNGNAAGSKTLVERLADAQDEAKSARRAMWVYGDFTEDDD